jgi:hypothetical protein
MEVELMRPRTRAASAARTLLSSKEVLPVKLAEWALVRVRVRGTSVSGVKGLSVRFSRPPLQLKAAFVE